MNRRGLPKNAPNVLARLRKILTKYDAVLAGGTAAALHLGHRLSEDLDFFANRSFDNNVVWAFMTREGLSYKLIDEGPHFVIAEVEGIKWSLFEYPYPFLQEPSLLEGIKVAGLTDIASMKVIALGQKGTRRDFIDLYFILQELPFHTVSRHMVEQFGADRINPIHIGKSLVYFTDAEADPEPRYLPRAKVEWEEVKQFFKDHTEQFVLDLDVAIRKG